MCLCVDEDFFGELFEFVLLVWGGVVHVLVRLFEFVMLLFVGVRAAVWAVIGLCCWFLFRFRFLGFSFPILLVLRRMLL